MTDDREANLLKLASQRDEDNLDDDTLAALASIRTRALNAIPDKKERKWVWHYGFATACLLLVIGFIIFNPPAETNDPSVELAFDMDLLLDEELDLLEEDLDFYLWLEEQGQEALL